MRCPEAAPLQWWQSVHETNRGTTVVPAFANVYIWATTNHRVAFSEPYLMSHGNPYGKDSFPPHEVLRRMLLALTYGAAPSIAYIQPSNLQAAVEQGLDEVKRRRPWLTHKKPEPWAALVMSDNTRNFYGRAPGLVEQRYMASVLGAFRAAVEEHLPLAVINDWNLSASNLAPYKVLIMSNTACLDDAKVAAVDQSVRAGGGLVACLDTSLFDELGTPRAGFALGPVLGVDYRGLTIAETTTGREKLDVNFARSIGPDCWEKRKDVFDYHQQPGSFLDRGRMHLYVGENNVTFKGPAVRSGRSRSGRAVVGTLRSRTGDNPAAREVPAVVTRSHGKGKVIYLAAGFDAANYLYAYPYHRLVLASAIRWAASEPPPVEVQAPMCVHSTVMR